jgi:hypothetical protein
MGSRLSAAEGSWLAEHGVTYAEFLQHMGSGYDRLMRSRSGGLQWIDGSPENALVGTELLTMYPEAQMLVLVRDPRDTCRSMLTSGFDELWARDGDEAIRTWVHYAETARALAAAHPEQVMLVSQEDMLATPAAVAASIGERLRTGDGTPIANFLTTQRVNSSFDRASLAEQRFSAAAAPDLSEDAFARRYGEKIHLATGALAAQFGYSV